MQTWPWLVLEHLITSEKPSVHEQASLSPYPPSHIQPLICLFSHRFACSGHFIEVEYNMWSLWMVSFTKYIIFKVHLCLSLYQYVNCTIFYPFISLWTLGFLHFLAFVNNAMLGICVLFLCECMVSFLLGVHLGLEFLGHMVTYIWASLVAQMVKNLPATQESLVRYMGKFPWGREWLPTPVLLPGHSVDRGAWWATVHGVAKSWTQLSD